MSRFTSLQSKHVPVSTQVASTSSLLSPSRSSRSTRFPVAEAATPVPEQRREHAGQSGFSLERISIFPPDIQRQERVSQERVSKEVPDKDNNALIREVAQSGIQTPSTALPFRERIQRSFGQHDLSQIQSHQGSDAAASARAMHARAYTSGQHIVFATKPTLSTVAHEAAHVVQQQHGVQVSGGVGKVGDAYERHANAVSERVTRGQPAEDLLGSPVTSQKIGTRFVNPLSPGRMPIQRLVGFEAELQVPSFDTVHDKTTFLRTDATHPVTDDIKRFVDGGIAYDTTLGGSLKNDPFYKVTTDKSSKTNRGRILAALKAKGYISEDALPNVASNLEYVTPPFDELAPGSDEQFKRQADTLKSHMRPTLTNAQGGRMLPFDAPATKGYTGIPQADLARWLDPDDYKELQPQWQALAEDRISLQATVGIIPSALRDLHRQVFSSSESENEDADAFRKSVLNAVDETINRLKDTEEYKKYVKDDFGEVSEEALLGLLHLLFVYIVSDVIYQTSAGVRTTVKNAVPLLIKMSTNQIIKEVGTSNLRKFELPSDFITYIANFLKNNEYATKNYWLTQLKGGEPIISRNTGGKRLITGDYADFVRRALGGEPNDTVSVIIGKEQLEKPDELPADVKSESYGQAGIPVEHRLIATRPTIDGLYAQMQKIIDQTRTLNLRHVPSKTQEEILGRVARSDKRSSEESDTKKDSKVRKTTETEPIFL